MTGIVAGAGVLTGVALGWWGALVIAGIGFCAVATLRSRPVMAVCVVALLASLVGALRGGDNRAPSAPNLSFGPPDVALIVTAPVRTGQRQYFSVEPTAPGANGSSGAAARICVTAGAVPMVQLGDEVRLDGGLQMATDVAIAQRAAMLARACDAAMFAAWVEVVGSHPGPARSVAALRSDLGAVLGRAVPGDAGVLLRGLVTGDDAGFSSETEAAFVKTGTTHLTAVSGSNLALVAGIMATIGTATLGRHRLVWQVVTAGTVWGYALVSGSQPPAIRAAIVVSAALLAFRFGRRADFTTLILLAAGAMALFDPRQIESLGFRLSVAASLALAIVLPVVLTSERLSGVAAVVTATAAAQLATLPILLPIFGMVSLSSLPANLIAAPLVAIAMPLAALAGLAGLVWMPLAEVLAAPAAFLATVLIQVVSHLDSPGSYVSVGAPPTDVAALVALTVSLLVLVLGGDAWRGLSRRSPIIATPTSAPAPHRGEIDTSGYPGLLTYAAEAGSMGAGQLATPALSLAREDPFDAFAPHAKDAKDDPAREQHRHQVADDGQRRQAPL